MERTLDGFDVGLDQAPGAHLLEGEAEGFEVGSEFGRLLVKAVADENLGELVGDDLDREAFEHEPDEAPPGFGTVLFEDGPCRRARRGRSNTGHGSRVVGDDWHRSGL